MPKSDSAANDTLDRETTSGGSWWVGFATNTGVDDLDEDLTVTVDESTLPRVELPRTSSAWETPSGREVNPVDDLDFGFATDDETATFWVLWDAETAGSPQYAGRIPDTDFTVGSRVVLPAESLVLIHP